MDTSIDELSDAATPKNTQRFQVQRVRYASLNEPADVPQEGELGEEFSLDQISPDSEEAAERNRHDSSRSHGDTVSDTHDTYRKHDTHNLKTFGANTQERIPRLDFYRATESVDQKNPYKRPTLAQLREEQEEPTASEKAPLVADEDDPAVKKAQASKFGWIKGVLVRCLLNIWGVMLFLRLSWVVGQAGIGYGSLIIVLSSVVTVITSLSMSAICTNGEVKGGGAYYMISRSLGPEFGGAIGIIFSLANAIAVAMYVVGFAETVRDLLEAGDMLVFNKMDDVRMIGVITCTGLLAVSIIGMEWEAKAQIVLLVVLLISIVDYVIGVFIPPRDDQIKQGNLGLYNGSPFKENFGPGFTEGENFFSVFSIFFPAATGILAGANISGDLKNPAIAIPKGTLLAILLTGISYLACLWLLGATVIRYSDGDGGVCAEDSICKYGLINSYRVMEMVSAFGPIIIAGIFAATLSSALASLVSAPKVFQAVCKDKIFPYIHIFSKGYGASEEPRLAYFLTYIIAVGFICIGDLNAIAPLISNFFLMAYALINYSCFDASLSNTPGWRPSFKYYNMYVALFGGVICFIIMFIIKWWAALITLTFVALLYGYVHYKKPDINWGSSMQAHAYKNGLSSALKLLGTKEHVKNFRPQILVLSGTPQSRPALVDFSNNICKGISLLICGHVILAEPGTRSTVHSSSKLDRIYDMMSKRKVKGFYNYVTSHSFREGAFNLIQTAGLGKLKPNMIMVGFKNNWLNSSAGEVQGYVDVILDAFDSQFGVGILRVAKGFDITSFISEEELLLVSHGKGKPAPKSAIKKVTTKSPEPEPENLATSDSFLQSPKTENYLKPPSAHKSTSAHRSAPADEEEEDDDEEFDEDEVAMTTIYGSKKLSREIVPEINRFHVKQTKATIDVWWLFDDGGLTLLIPHILSTKPYWQDCKLRVFLAGSKKGQLNKEQKNMATLLSKFRIDYQDMEVIPSFGKPPSSESKKMFEETLRIWQTNLENSREKTTLVSEEQLIINQERTNRHLRTRDLVYEKSKNSALIVMTLPVPRKGQPEALYMTWIDCLSRGLPAPVLLLRGNQASVLTFYS